MSIYFLATIPVRPLAILHPTFVEGMTAAIDRLQSLSFAFEGLADEEVRRFVAKSKIVENKPNEYLFHENDPPSFVYLIRSGEWMTERSLANGSREVGNFTTVGEFVGIGDVDVYSYSFKALTYGQANRFSERDFWQFVKNTPSAQEKFDIRRNQKIRDWTHRAIFLGKMKAHERLCVFLVKVADLQRTNMTAVRLNMTRQDIADYLGLTSDTVTRELKKLVAEGVIRIDKSARNITFMRPQTIIEFAEGV